MHVGQAGIFFLHTDSKNALCRHIEYALPIGKWDIQFDNAVKAIAVLSKVYADPSAALMADKPRDRQFAAIALVARYRAAHPSFSAQSNIDEPIPVKQSQRILEALAEMKWSDPPLDAEGAMTLPNAFARLQLNDKDGWQPPQPQANDDSNELMSQAVATWLRDHAATYCIQRRVAKESDAKRDR